MNPFNSSILPAIDTKQSRSIDALRVYPERLSGAFCIYGGVLKGVEG